MDTEAQLREALNRLPAPTENSDWFRMLTPLKSAGFDLEEIVEWSRRGGVKEKWLPKLRQRWHQLREMDHDHAVNTVFKRARDAGWQSGPARSSSRRAPTPPDLARMAQRQKSFRGTVREGTVHRRRSQGRVHLVCSQRQGSVSGSHRGRAGRVPAVSRAGAGRRCPGEVRRGDYLGGPARGIAQVPGVPSPPLPAHH